MDPIGHFWEEGFGTLSDHSEDMGIVFSYILQEVEFGADLRGERDGRVRRRKNWHHLDCSHPRVQGGINHTDQCLAMEGGDCGCGGN